jgi:hypothetical protein
MAIVDQGSPTHAVSWLRYEDQGAEFAELWIGDGRLAARSTAIGAGPIPYRAELELETVDGFITSRLEVTARGLGWKRSIDLRRSEAGVWTADVATDGEVDLGEPGGDLSQFEDALDPDVELCPILNSLPTLRHGLLEGGTAPEMVMVWVELPSLTLHRSVQRYSYVGKDAAGNHVVRFENPDPDEGDFVEDITFDADGIVLDYPTVARRIGVRASGRTRTSRPRRGAPRGSRI